MRQKTIKQRSAGRLRGRGGFTLVELIVVIVIIAILASVLVVSLIGYIGKARRAALTEECRTCVVAAQSLATEAYARGDADLTPAAADVLSLSEAKGEASAIQVDADTARVLHLTYARGGLSVTYCAEPDTCDLHEEMYNFSDSAGTGGGTGGGSAADGSVTVTASDGETYTLAVSGSWADIKAKIAESGWNITSGAVLTDETGTYLCCNWSQYIPKTDTSSMTLAALTAMYPTNFEKIDSSTMIWTAADVSGGKWTSPPKAGELCYYGGSYYVAPGTIGLWTMPPGGWVKVIQN